MDSAWLDAGGVFGIAYLVLAMHYKATKIDKALGFITKGKNVTSRMRLVGCDARPTIKLWCVLCVFANVADQVSLLEARYSASPSTPDLIRRRLMMLDFHVQLLLCEVSIMLTTTRYSAAIEVSFVRGPGSVPSSHPLSQLCLLYSCSRHAWACALVNRS